MAEQPAPQAGANGSAPGVGPAQASGPRGLDPNGGGRGPRLQWPLSSVLIGLVFSLIVVASDHFRRGSVLFASFVVLAFCLRLALSDRAAGLLVVRSRGIDLACLGALGAGLWVFALVVPPPS